LGFWPKAGTFGNEKFEILRRDPVFDNDTGWVLVTLNVGSSPNTKRIHSVLDIRKPSDIEKSPVSTTSGIGQTWLKVA
jgi:hypothetical protein